MQIDRHKVIAALGGDAAVETMGSEARAEGLESYLAQELDSAILAKMGAPAEVPNSC